MKTTKGIYNNSKYEKIIKIVLYHVSIKILRNVKKNIKENEFFIVDFLVKNIREN